MPRAYRDANGVTEGSIMAAIISVQMPRNDSRPSPMVPGMDPMCRAARTTPVHAAAATSSNEPMYGARRASERDGGAKDAVMAPRSHPLTGVSTGPRSARLGGLGRGSDALEGLPDAIDELGLAV